jgi:hypothetical protein
MVVVVQQQRIISAEREREMELHAAGGRGMIAAASAGLSQNSIYTFWWFSTAACATVFVLL